MGKKSYIIILEKSKILTFGKLIIMLYSKKDNIPYLWLKIFLHKRTFFGYERLMYLWISENKCISKLNLISNVIIINAHCVTD